MRRSSSPPIEATGAAVAPIGLAVGALGLLYRGDLDARLVDPYFDPATNSWPLAGDWLLNDVLHHGGKLAIVGIGVALLTLLIVGLVNPRWEHLRRPALFGVLCIGLSAGAVGVMKSMSSIPCPWEAVRYGGSIPHHLPFEAVNANVPKGRCFPCAHAAGAFALMAAYFLFRERSLRLAWTALAAGALLGVFYTAVQVTRGAHFPSHGAWSCITAWTVSSALYWGLFQGRVLRPARGVSQQGAADCMHPTVH